MVTFLGHLTETGLVPYFFILEDKDQLGPVHLCLQLAAVAVVILHDLKARHDAFST